MENFDMLFTEVNHISTAQRNIEQVQEQLKNQLDLSGAAMDQYSAEQRMIAQQVKANGQAVA